MAPTTHDRQRHAAPLAKRAARTARARASAAAARGAPAVGTLDTTVSGAALCPRGDSCTQSKHTVSASRFGCTSSMKCWSWVCPDGGLEVLLPHPVAADGVAVCFGIHCCAGLQCGRRRTPRRCPSTHGARGRAAGRRRCLLRHAGRRPARGATSGGARSGDQHSGRCRNMRPRRLRRPGGGGAPPGRHPGTPRPVPGGTGSSRGAGLRSLYRAQLQAANALWARARGRQRPGPWVALGAERARARLLWAPAEVPGAQVRASDHRAPACPCCASRSRPTLAALHRATAEACDAFAACARLHWAPRVRSRVRWGVSLSCWPAPAPPRATRAHRPPGRPRRAGAPLPDACAGRSAPSCAAAPLQPHPWPRTHPAWGVRPARVASVPYSCPVALSAMPRHAALLAGRAGRTARTAASNAAAQGAPAPGTPGTAVSGAALSARRQLHAVRARSSIVASGLRLSHTCSSTQRLARQRHAALLAERAGSTAEQCCSCVL